MSYLPHRTRSFFGLCLALVVSVVSTGCAAEVTPQEQAFEVGTGSWRFEAVEDGAQVELVRGTQGAWHVWVSARARNVQDGDRLILETQIADGSLPVQTVELTPTFDPPNSQGYRNFVGWPAQLNNVECLVGELLRIRATLMTQEGEFEAERDVMVMPGADPPGACE